MGLALGLAVWATAVEACGGEKPPAVAVERDLTCASGAGVRFCTDAEAASAGRDATSDATGRAVLALENATAKAALATSLGRLESALAQGNITQARLASADARTALGGAGGQAADAPDLGAIELLLDHVDPLIGR